MKISILIPSQEMLWDKSSNKSIPIYDPVLQNHELFSSLDMQCALYFVFTDSLWGWCNISLILQDFCHTKWTMWVSLEALSEALYVVFSPHTLFVKHFKIVISGNYQVSSCRITKTYFWCLLCVDFSRKDGSVHHSALLVADEKKVGESKTACWGHHRIFSLSHYQINRSFMPLLSLSHH